jgi:hypothetical protein
LRAHLEEPLIRHRVTVIRLLQTAALEQLHHDERRFRRFIQLMDDADAGMIQGRSCSSLKPEAFEGGRVLTDRLGEQLDGDMAAKLLIDRLINDAHSALAEFANDLVVAKEGAGRQLFHIQNLAYRNGTPQGKLFQILQPSPLLFPRLVAQEAPEAANAKIAKAQWPATLSP